MSDEKQPGVCGQPEEWRPVKDYEGLYEVSNQGRIKRIAPGKGARVGYILKPWEHRVHGMIYHYITLTRNGTQDKYPVHRLECEAFIGAVTIGMEVHHIDNNPSNNQLENLALVTHKQNMEACCAARRQSWGERNGHCKLSCKDIEDIRSSFTGEWGQVTKLGRVYGVTPGHISNVLSGSHRKLDAGNIIAPRLRPNRWHPGKRSEFARRVVFKHPNPAVIGMTDLDGDINRKIDQQFENTYGY